MRRRDLPTAFNANAPLRLDFAGAWTDVPPFSAREGGVVVNGAIGLRAHAELRLGGTLLRLVSDELGETLECANSGGLSPGGKLNLVKAALRMFPVLGGFTLTTRSDAPPGSGLGSSGALGVALVGALTHARQERRGEREVAEQAWQVEAVEAQIPGGRQDQYAAALGGFHRLSFRDPDVGVEPLTLDPAFAAALERQTLLCYTNTSRVSGDTIARVMGAYERGDGKVTGALRALKDVAEAMAEALRGADLARVGVIRSEGVPVGDKEEAVVLVLELHPVVQGAQVIAQVQAARGPHPAQHAQLGHGLRSSENPARRPAPPEASGVRKGKPSLVAGGR